MKIYLVRETISDGYTYSSEITHAIFGKRSQAEECLEQVIKDRLEEGKDSDVSIIEQEIDVDLYLVFQQFCNETSYHGVFSSKENAEEAKEKLIKKYGKNSYINIDQSNLDEYEDF